MQIKNFFFFMKNDMTGDMLSEVIVQRFQEVSARMKYVPNLHLFVLNLDTRSYFRSN